MELTGLYAITPENNPSDPSLTHMVEAALCGGARIIQYRDKGTDPSRRRREAEKLVDLCRAAGALLIVNDDVELAAVVGAHGVHLGKDDLPPPQARDRLGPGALIGVSCYNDLDLARRAVHQGADYVAFGRFYPSDSKPLAVQAYPDLLRRARQTLDVPIVAIGGISPQNGGLLIEAGAHMLAAINAVFGAADIRAAAQAFTRLFAQEKSR